MDNITVNNKLNSMTKLLNNYKKHYLYAKTFGDFDIARTYFNKVQDLLAQEMYGEFGYDTCCLVEKEEVLDKTLKLLHND
jgi:hypothetical protein|tara:strand:- start:455 stop:694 length:240 start_codon:yes stop_codon:yes gene_type:complete